MALSIIGAHIVVLSGIAFDPVDDIQLDDPHAHRAYSYSRVQVSFVRMILAFPETPLRHTSPITTAPRGCSVDRPRNM